MDKIPQSYNPIHPLNKDSNYYQPFFTDRMDYNTNADSYYKYLAYQNKLMQTIVDVTNATAERNIIVKESDSILAKESGSWETDTTKTYDINLKLDEVTPSNAIKVTERGVYVKDLNNDVMSLTAERRMNSDIDFNLYGELTTVDDYNIVQGSCFTERFALFAYTKSDDSHTMIRVYDKRTFEHVNDIYGPFYHANTLTYNEDEQTVIVTHCINNGVPDNRITIIPVGDLTSNAPKMSTKVLEQFKQVQSVEYYKGHYYVNANVNIIYILNSEYEIVDYFATQDNAIVQDMSIYNDLLFILRINLQSGYINKDLVSNAVSVIEVYTLTGNYLKNYIVPIKNIGNEIESFKHFTDGVFISQWKGYGTVPVTMSRVFSHSKFNIQNVKNVNTWATSTVTVYIDSNYKGALVDGTAERPFKQFSLAMKWLKSLSGNFNITLNVKGTHEGFTFISIGNLKINFLDGATCTALNITDCNINLQNPRINGRVIIEGSTVVLNGSGGVTSKEGTNAVSAQNSKLYWSGLSNFTVNNPIILFNSDLYLGSKISVPKITNRGGVVKYTASQNKGLYTKITNEGGGEIYSVGTEYIDLEPNFSKLYEDSVSTGLELKLNGTYATLYINLATSNLNNGDYTIFTAKNPVIQKVFFEEQLDSNNTLMGITDAIILRVSGGTSSARISKQIMLEI